MIKPFNSNEYHNFTINFNYGYNFSGSLSTYPNLVTKGKVHGSKSNCFEEIDKLLKIIKYIIITNDKESFYNLFTVGENQRFLFKQNFENITHRNNINYKLQHCFEYLESITIEYISSSNILDYTHIPPEINYFKFVIEINIKESCVKINDKIIYFIKNQCSITEKIKHGIEYVLNNKIIESLKEKIPCDKEGTIMLSWM